MKITNKYLFNFTVSYTGGGYKRLCAYAKWFSENGGAWFIIHPRCQDIKKMFPNNRYFIQSQRRYERIFNDSGYLSSILNKIGEPDLYYSYGIPVYKRVGVINWFHLSNILPIFSDGIVLSFYDKFIRLKLLSLKIKKNYKNADVISAESSNSLNLMGAKVAAKSFLSVNGSGDEELDFLINRSEIQRFDFATIVGTQTYKALLDSYYIFEMLRSSNSGLKLIIIGCEMTIPKKLRLNENVIIKGMLPRESVFEYLKNSKYFITTSRIENSSNATSEGVIFSSESYISDIEPHRELLINESYDYVSVPHIDTPIIHVKSKNLTGSNLKSWDDVIIDINNLVEMKLKDYFDAEI